MSVKQAEDLVIELADLVEDIEAELMYPEAIPAALLKPLCADLGLAVERLGKHQEALAQAERAHRCRPAPRVVAADDDGP